MHIVYQILSIGLSPRVRGNPDDTPEGSELTRSIPACAGEPRFSNQAVTGAEVYPRVCGGTLNQAFIQPTSQGLSPRVRGNPGNDGTLSR